MKVVEPVVAVPQKAAFVDEEEPSRKLNAKKAKRRTLTGTLVEAVPCMQER